MKIEVSWFPRIHCRLATPLQCHRVRVSLTIIVAELRRELLETDSRGRRPAPGRAEAREVTTRERRGSWEIRSVGALSTQWAPRLPRRFLYLLSLLASARRGQRRGHATPVMATAGPLPSFRWTACCLLPAITIHRAMSAAPLRQVLGGNFRMLAYIYIRTDTKMWYTRNEHVYVTAFIDVVNYNFHSLVMKSMLQLQQSLHHCRCSL